MLLKDSSGPRPIDAVDLLTGSLWCWAAVLTLESRTCQGLSGSQSLPDELSCSLPATTLPTKSPQGEQPPTI